MKKYITAKKIITMDPEIPFVTAVAFDDESGKIIAIGDKKTCKAACTGEPSVDEDESSCETTCHDHHLIDLKERVLMPGFIDSHSHPLFGGILTEKPSIWIAPYLKGKPQSWDELTKFFEIKNQEANETEKKESLKEKIPLFFNGLDRLLLGCKEPTAIDLDKWFDPDRIVAVMDNSGHAAYCNTAALEYLKANEWDNKWPEAPEGSSYGKTDNGDLNGISYETPAVMTMIIPILKMVVKDPATSAGKWYATMAANGITSTSELTYENSLKVPFEDLANIHSCPIRVSVYHMSTDAGYEKEVNFNVNKKDMLVKKGIKLWADGSPWIGNINESEPYLNSKTNRDAGIEPGVKSHMNYKLDELKKIIQKGGPQWQMAFHCNGDNAIDIVLNAYADCLDEFDLNGTDHRWRLEHLGGATIEQFIGAKELDLCISMGPFQFEYWGDLLAGKMFKKDFGEQWCRIKDATDMGLRPSYHNDGPVTPPSPLHNIKTCVTRTTNEGTALGLNQKVSLDDALKAQTIDAAYSLFMDDKVGSIETGKYADFVVLSADPYEVYENDPMELIDETVIKVDSTWLNGTEFKPGVFLEELKYIDNHEKWLQLVGTAKRCC